MIRKRAIDIPINYQTDILIRYLMKAGMMEMRGAAETVGTAVTAVTVGL